MGARNQSGRLPLLPGLALPDFDDAPTAVPHAAIVATNASVPLPATERSWRRTGSGLHKLSASSGDDTSPQRMHARIEPGEVVQGTRYRVIALLGEGGMGVVYEAEHIDLERRVALKVLHPQLSGNPRLVQMFRNEAIAVSRVGAEQIVQLYDFARLRDGRTLFTMELLQGPTLFDALQKGPFDPARCIGILRQICKGLGAAHRARVVHRDIKPENIVLEHRQGRKDSVKILDFGIATVLGGAGDRPFAAGTPLYLAPELILSEESDHRVDIYAVGCVAYEMLVGRPPFAGEDDVISNVLRQHLEDEPQPLTQIDARIPEVLSRVILKCLSKSVDDRYATMEALELALCEAQADAGLSSPWDELSLPDAAPPDLRARLFHPGITRPVRERPSGWRRFASSSLILGLGAAVGLFGFAPTFDEFDESALARPAFAALVMPAPVEDHRVADLLIEARAAAARSFFVFPPADAPTAPTAYGTVVALEALRGAHIVEGTDRAERAAIALRNEFAATLVRLGDSYWDREAGRPFAIDYYRQALVFDGSHARAKERAGLSDPQIEQFRERAGTVDFSPAEIEAAEPLTALAEPDKAERERKLVELGKSLRGRRGARAALRDLADVDLAPASAGGDSAIPDEPIELEADPTAGGAEFAGESSDDLVERGKRARAEGRRDEARAFFMGALHNDAHHVGALEGLVSLALDGGDPSGLRRAETIAYAKRLVELEPKQARHQERLGDVYAKLGRLDEALRAFRSGAALGSSTAAESARSLEARLLGRSLAQGTAAGNDTPS